MVSRLNSIASQSLNIQHTNLDVGGTLVGSICIGFDTKHTARHLSPPAAVSTSTFFSHRRCKASPKDRFGISNRGGFETEEEGGGRGVKQKRKDIAGKG